MGNHGKTHWKSHFGIFFGEWLDNVMEIILDCIPWKHWVTPLHAVGKPSLELPRYLDWRLVIFETIAEFLFWDMFFRDPISIYIHQFYYVLLFFVAISD